MKIYTKTGDDGTTGILGSARLNKFDARIEAYGNVDELNSHVGMWEFKSNSGGLRFGFLKRTLYFHLKILLSRKRGMCKAKLN